MDASDDEAECLKGMSENLHEFLVNREAVHRIMRQHLDSLAITRARILSDDISNELKWPRWQEHVNRFRDTAVVPFLRETLQHQLYAEIFEIVESELRDLLDLKRRVHRSLSP